MKDEHKNEKYSTKEVIIAFIVVAVFCVALGGIVKILNLDIDSSVELILLIPIALVVFWLSLRVIRGIGAKK
jgi:small neutral amino acid transporter SnatA (MarC family)